MTNLAVGMCICWVNIRTNLDSFATTLDCGGKGPCSFQGALGNSISLNNLQFPMVPKQESLSHSEYSFISLYCNTRVFPFYPLTGVPIVK